MNSPKHDQVITFSKIPPGSYCTAGAPYRVDRHGDKGSFRFVNVEQGSSTYDEPWAVKRSVWTAV